MTSLAEGDTLTVDSFFKDKAIEMSDGAGGRSRVLTGPHHLLKVDLLGVNTPTKTRGSISNLLMKPAITPPTSFMPTEGPHPLAAAYEQDFAIEYTPVPSEPRWVDREQIVLAASVELTDKLVHAVLCVRRPAMTGSGVVGGLSRLPVGKLDLR